MKRTAFKIQEKSRARDHISQVSGWDSRSCWRRAEGTNLLRGILALLWYDTRYSSACNNPLSRWKTLQIMFLIKQSICLLLFFVVGRNSLQPHLPGACLPLPLCRSGENKILFNNKVLLAGLGDTPGFRQTQEITVGLDALIIAKIGKMM